jgi:DNA-binding response OmpR family regulator
MENEAKKILIVEDEEFLADMYRIKFQSEGFKVFVANNGTDGIKIATEELPDFILLDLVMPGIDGFQVLKTLRENENTKKLLIYVFSNLGQSSEVERGINEGADGYLIKSNLTPSQMMEKVKAALSGEKVKLNEGEGVIKQ